MAMPTVYVRQVSLKESLSDASVGEYWQWILSEVIPAMQKIPGIRSVRAFSGAGGLRADLRFVIEMDDGGVYERMLADQQFRPLLARIYSAWDMKTASQTFVREITPELLRALGGT
jgi:hypothetical protein